MKKNIVLFISFIFLTIFVIFKLTKPIDDFVEQNIIYFHNSFLTLFFKFISFLGTFYILGSIILILLFKNFSKYKTILINSSIILVLNSFLKLLINRPRPEVLNLVHETTKSYPSGHAISITAFILMFIYLNPSKKLKYLYFLIFLMSLSRIYLGVHYLSDVLAGVILATLISRILFTILIEKK